jgi:hypothetical protein
MEIVDDTPPYDSVLNLDCDSELGNHLSLVLSSIIEFIPIKSSKISSYQES